MTGRYNVIANYGARVIGTDAFYGWNHLFDLSDPAIPVLSKKAIQEVAEKIRKDPDVENGQELHDKLMQYV